MTQREAVWLADNGTCVACGKRWPRWTIRGGLLNWDSHHVVKQARLRREHVPVRYVRTEALCVLLCHRPCHERQTSAFARVPFDRLPERVIRAAAELGPWAEDALLREHPKVTA